MIIAEIREWVVFLIDAGILYILIMEYNYDKEKDSRKSRKTKTTKKATTMPDGTIVTQEDIETTESKDSK